MNTQSGLSFAAVEALLTINPTARARHMDWYGGVWLKARHSRVVPAVTLEVTLGEDRWYPWDASSSAAVNDPVWNVCWVELTPKDSSL